MPNILHKYQKNYPKKYIVPSEANHMKRVQSPSSMNTYFQCPRKYFYQYNLKLETLPSIHLVRGNIAHTVLEDFYTQDISNINMENFETQLRVKIQELLIKTWKDYDEKLKSLNLSHDVLTFYFEETLLLLTNWADKFIARVQSFDDLSFQEIFQKLLPIREQQFISEELSVRGFIDLIEDRGGEIHVMDYKTSKRFNITPGYRRQLAVYAILYKKKYGVSPGHLLCGSESDPDQSDVLRHIPFTERESAFDPDADDEDEDFSIWEILDREQEVLL